MLYCPPVLYFRTRSLGPRPCSTILPITFTFEISSAETNFFSSVRTDSTSSNVILPPSFPSSVSTRTVLPGSTRYCFPPLRMTAYMLPPEASDKPQLYGLSGICVNEHSTKITGELLIYPIYRDLDARVQPD